MRIFCYPIPKGSPGPASGPRSLRRGHLQSFSDCRADGPPNRNRLPAPFRPPADRRRFLVELRIGSSQLAISAKQAHDSRHYTKQEADCVAPTADFELPPKSWTGY